jgi:hypothetical protein
MLSGKLPPAASRLPSDAPDSAGALSRACTPTRHTTVRTRHLHGAAQVHTERVIAAVARSAVAEGEGTAAVVALDDERITTLSSTVTAADTDGQRDDGDAYPSAQEAPGCELQGAEAPGPESARACEEPAVGDADAIGRETAPVEALEAAAGGPGPAPAEAIPGKAAAFAARALGSATAPDAAAPVAHLRAMPRPAARRAAGRQRWARLASLGLATLALMMVLAVLLAQLHREDEPTRDEERAEGEATR